jgi:RNA polymerase sigma-70 factor (ECF subfamily)
MLRARNARRAEPFDAHLPDPIVDRADGVATEHEALTPAERFAYVLHDMFSVPFDEIGAILDRSSDTARQLASRERRRIPGADLSPGADPAAQQAVVEAFLAAAREGDLDALVAVLDPEVVRRAPPDMGDGLIVEIRGADNVARTAMAVSQLGPAPRPALVNGAPGWVALLDGAVSSIGALTLHNARITTIDILADASRLAHLDQRALDSQSP